jgi:multidrug efflux pump subunit AcrA (membrane-fusion protein)
MFTIENLAELEITSVVPEYDAALLKPGLAVNILTDAIQDAEWSGTIHRISPVAVDENGNFKVTVSVTSPVGDLKSGMSAKLNIICDSREGVFAVPYGALGENGGGDAVIYTLADAKPPGGAEETSDGTERNAGAAWTRVEIPVTTGLETDYYIEISGSGLEEGLPVLTDPEGLNTDVPEASPLGMGAGF